MLCDFNRGCPDPAPSVVFSRIVAACLDLEWQIMPRAVQRGVKASPQVEEKFD
jgi:hypothetical protein